MPVPRRFDRRLPERDTTRTNERIRVPEVRVIGDDGQQVGIMKTEDALNLAMERELDLVEVAPEARPPVCRILDYSKYKYEQAQKQKAARKHQTQITIREIKFRPKIAQHDYDTKKGHVTRFLLHKDKVKITIMFRGREVTHPERGKMILDRLAEELEELAIIEQRPNLDGRNMTMVLGPSKAVLADEIDAKTWAEKPKELDEPEGDEVAQAAPAGAASQEAGDAPAEVAVAGDAGKSPVEPAEPEAPAADAAPEATAADAQADAPQRDGAGSESQAQAPATSGG